MKGQSRSKFFFGIASFLSVLISLVGIMFAIFAFMFIASYFGGIEKFLYDVIYTYPYYIVIPCALLISLLLVGLTTYIVLIFKKVKITSVTHLLLSNTAAITANVISSLVLLSLLEMLDNISSVNIPLYVLIGVGFILTIVNVLLSTDLRHKATPRSAKRRAFAAIIISLIYLGGYIACTFLGYVHLLSFDFLKENIALAIIFGLLLICLILHLVSIFVYPRRYILEVAGISDVNKLETEDDMENGEEEVIIRPTEYVISAHQYENNIKITAIDVPINYTRIEAYAFAGCKHMREAIIPNSIQEIGEHAFAGCLSLKEMTYLGTCEQFKAMKRGQGWIDATLIVHCSNGHLKIEMKKQGGNK